MPTDDPSAKRLAWYANRIRRMQFAEIGPRIRNIPVTMYELKRLQGRSLPTPDLLRPACNGRRIGNLTFDPSQRARYKQLLASTLDETRQRANDLVNRRFAVLGVPIVDSAGSIPWHLDPWSGNEAPQRFCKAIPHRFGEKFSAKHIWELNRHHHWTELARACFILEDRRFGEEVWSQWRSWLAANPPLVGINWTSPIELGVRILSWAYAAAFLEPSEAPPGLWDEILSSIHSQAEYIRRNISRGSSANNHLVAEALGLFVAGTIFVDLKRARLWQRIGREKLIAALRDQVGPDGVHREQSVAYHQFALDLWLVAGLIGQANDIDFPETYWRTIESMVDYLACILDSGGNLPRFGDDDDAHAVVLSVPARLNLAHSQLASASVLFRRGDLKALVPTWDERSTWLLGPDAADQFAALPLQPTNSESRAFADSGVYVMRRGPRGVGERLVAFDAGPLGFGPIAAHGHADSLSFTLSIGGVPVFIDPGTFTYHADPEWRSYFKGTGAHNTAQVDGTDQSKGGGPTLWTRHANTTVHVWQASRSSDEILASHDGYSGLGIIHSRRFIYLRDEDRIEIEDSFAGRGVHSIEIRFHMPSPTAITKDEVGYTITCSSARLQMVVDPKLTVQVRKGELDPIVGWNAPHFGVRVESPTLCAFANLALPETVTTTIFILP